VGRIARNAPEVLFTPASGKYLPRPQSDRPRGTSRKNGRNEKGKAMKDGSSQREKNVSNTATGNCAPSSGAIEKKSESPLTRKVGGEGGQWERRSGRKRRDIEGGHLGGAQTMR